MPPRNKSASKKRPVDAMASSTTDQQKAAKGTESFGDGNPTKKPKVLTGSLGGSTHIDTGSPARRSGRERKPNSLLKDMKVDIPSLNRKSSKQSSESVPDVTRHLEASQHVESEVQDGSVTNGKLNANPLANRIEGTQLSSFIKVEQCPYSPEACSSVDSSNISISSHPSAQKSDLLPKSGLASYTKPESPISSQLQEQVTRNLNQNVQACGNVALENTPAPSHEMQVILVDMDTGEKRVVGSNIDGKSDNSPSEKLEATESELVEDSGPIKEQEMEGEMMSLLSLFLQNSDQKKEDDDSRSSGSSTATLDQGRPQQNLAGPSLVESLPKVNSEDEEMAQIMVSIDGQMHMVTLPVGTAKLDGADMPGQLAEGFGNTQSNMGSRSGLETTDGETEEDTEGDNLLVDTDRDVKTVPPKSARDKEDFLRVSEDGLFCCMKCSYSTDKKVNWYKHKIKHRDRQYRCAHCPYMAKTSSNMKRHLLVHEGVKNFMCDQCDARFNQKIHLVRHIKYKHEKREARCTYCDYVGSSIQPDLVSHVRRKHHDLCTIDKHGNIQPKNDSGSLDNLMKHKCEQCNLYTVSRKDLLQHLKFHKKGAELKFFCELCSFVTECESRLKRHILTHTKEKPFRCGMCDYRANEMEHVKRHMKNKHQVESLPIRRVSAKPKNDDHVEGGDGALGFIQKRKYPKTDPRNSEKHFACNFCTMKFAKLLNLFKHVHVQHKQMMQTEMMPYSCVVCDYSTFCYKRLLVHMRRMHSTTNPFNPPQKQVYVCMLCNYSSPYKLYLHAHLKKVHSMHLVSDKEGVNKYMLDASMMVQATEDSNAKKPGCIIKRVPGMEPEQPPKDSKMVLVQLTQDGPMTPVYISTGDTDASTSLLPGSDGDNEYPIMETGIMDGTPLCLESCEDQDLGQVLKEVSLAPLATSKGSVSQMSTKDTSMEHALVVAKVQAVQGPSDPQEENAQGSGLSVVPVEANEEDGNPNEQNPSEVDSEQVVHLSSGDFVEINGQIYKIEMENNEEGAEQLNSAPVKTEKSHNDSSVGECTL